MSTNEIELKKLKDGIKRCVRLVENLLEDSEILLKRKRYSSSIALSIIAWEEISKAHIMRLQMKKGKGLPMNVWRELTTGRKAHAKKLSSIMFERKKRLEQKMSSKADAYLNEIAQRLGLPGLADGKTAHVEAIFLEKLFPKLNAVKQDCLYLNLDKNTNNWINFENRFSNKIKEAVAKFLIATIRRTTAYQKFIFEISMKPFQKYTKEDWVIALKSKHLKEIQNVYRKTNTKEMGHISDLAMIAIDSYRDEKKSFEKSD